MASWILSLAATVRIYIPGNGQTVDTGWDFDKTMVINHHPYQVNGQRILRATGAGDGWHRKEAREQRQGAPDASR